MHSETLSRYGTGWWLHETLFSSLYESAVRVCLWVRDYQSPSLVSAFHLWSQKLFPPCSQYSQYAIVSAFSNWFQQSLPSYSIPSLALAFPLWLQYFLSSLSIPAMGSTFPLLVSAFHLFSLHIRSTVYVRDYLWSKCQPQWLKFWLKNPSLP